MERFRKERYESDYFMPRRNSESSLGIFELTMLFPIAQLIEIAWRAVRLSDGCLL
jgi:hypothetical protein